VRKRGPPPPGEHRLDVDHGGAIDGLDRSDAQPVPDDPSDDDGMKAQRVRPVGRSRCEDPRERIAPVRARVDLEHIAPGAVQPRDDDDLVAGCEALEARRRPGVHFEPGIGCSLRSLFRRLAAPLERRFDDSDGPE